MRRSLHIVFALVVALVVVGSCNRLPRPAATPSIGGRTAHEALVGIDSLMWVEADSALAGMGWWIFILQIIGNIFGYCQKFVFLQTKENSYGKNDTE
jgi:hypothetical protein